MAVERITLEEAQKRMQAQGQPRDHIAFVCPICSTVQSMASLKRVGVPEDKVEDFIGFSCEGRWTSAGPWPSDKDKTAKAKKRRMLRGCDWTLGGLFRLHNLEVVMPDGKERVNFEIATADQAAELRAFVDAPAAA